MVRNFKRSLTFLVILVLVGATYAFAATNTIPASNAGYSATVVDGYAVSIIVYDLFVADPTEVEKVTFTVTPITTNVVAKLVKIQTATGLAWKDCAVTASVPPTATVICSYASGALDLIDVTALNIIVSSSLDP